MEHNEDNLPQNHQDHQADLGDSEGIIPNNQGITTREGEPLILLDADTEHATALPVNPDYNLQDSLGELAGFEPRASGNITPGRKNYKLHRPRKVKGDRAVWNENLDRSVAKVGKRDDSKLRIDFRTVRDDPNKPGESIPGHPVKNRYPYPVNWDDKRSVDKLNAWRRQIFARNFSNVRKTRLYWLEDEKAFLVELLKEQLKTRRRPNWKKLANAYNRNFNGTTQKKGSRYVTMRKKPTKDTAKSAILQADRPAPWRTWAAMSNQCTKWADVQAMVQDALQDKANEADARAAENENSSEEESDDEEELLEPSSDIIKQAEQEEEGQGQEVEEDESNDEEELQEGEEAELAAVEPSFEDLNGVDEAEAMQRLTSQRQIAKDRGTYLRGG